MSVDNDRRALVRAESVETLVTFTLGFFNVGDKDG